MVDPRPNGTPSAVERVNQRYPTYHGRCCLPEPRAGDGCEVQRPQQHRNAVQE